MAASNTFSTYQEGLDSPVSNWAAVTPHDTNELSYVSRAVWVGGAGNLNVVTAGDDSVTFSGIQAGTLLPIRVKKILSTSTTATLILAGW